MAHSACTAAGVLPIASVLVSFSSAASFGSTSALPRSTSSLCAVSRQNRLSSPSAAISSAVDALSSRFGSTFLSPYAIRYTRPCFLSRTGVTYALPLPFLNPCGTGLCWKM